MASEQFNELLKKMPTIAKAVNAFDSEDIQQQAYNALIGAFNGTNNTDNAGETQGKSGTMAESEKPKKSGAPSTADILAMARGDGGAPAAKPAAKKEDAKGKEAAKESPVEVFKGDSHFLRGDIPEELVDGTDHFGKSSIQLLKHHGTYQQDNRDARKAAAGKSGKSYMFMLRTKLPGGILSANQMLAELDIADQLGNQTLRITSRQGLQFHGIVKEGLQETIQRLDQHQLTALGACGDVNRNVMCCPAPYKDPVHQTIQDLAQKLGDHFAPKTRAYHQIWLKEPGGEKELVAGESNGQEVETLYGTKYLPRKFKMAVALPTDNCCDIYTDDLGYMAVVRDGKVIGYNLVVGGGQGRTPSADKTFPAVGQKMAFATPEQVIDAAEAIVKVQRDFGNRADRKVARMKYLIHNWGLPKFRAKVEEYFGGKLADAEPDEITGFNDHMGWDEQGDGKWFYGLNVENGRIKDTAEVQLKTAVRKICDEFQPGIHLTSHQSLIFTDIAEDQREDVQKILKSHNVPLTEEISTVRRYSMACVAWPTCGLSITEAERALPSIMDEMEAELDKLGLDKDRFTVRMTGCPNGCARPYNCDIGLVGRAQNKYTMFVGGRLFGNRLNFEFKDMVPEDEVVSTLIPLFVYYKQDRQEDESFGDFCDRKGKDDLLAYADNFSTSAG